MEPQIMDDFVFGVFSFNLKKKRMIEIVWDEREYKPVCYRH